MNKYIFKFVKILYILAVIIIILSNYVYALDVKSSFGGDINGADVSGIKTILGVILDIVRYIGAGVALIMLMYIGAKIMMASPSERANIKEYLINYVVGAFILLGTSGILSVIKTFAQEL